MKDFTLGYCFKRHEIRIQSGHSGYLKNPAIWQGSGNCFNLYKHLFSQPKFFSSSLPKNATCPHSSFFGKETPGNYHCYFVLTGGGPWAGTWTQISFTWLPWRCAHDAQRSILQRFPRLSWIWSLLPLWCGRAWSHSMSTHSTSASFFSSQAQPVKSPRSSLILHITQKSPHSFLQQDRHTFLKKVASIYCFVAVNMKPMCLTFNQCLTITCSKL